MTIHHRDDHRGRPLHQHLAGVVDLAERIATGTRSWRAFAPRPAVLDQAIAEADALARALRELRQAMAAEGGPPDAA